MSSGSITQYICSDFKNVAKTVSSATTVNFNQSKSFVLKIFSKIITVKLFVLIKALLKNRLNLVKSITKHLNLDEILDKKISNLSRDELVILKISTLMLSNKKRWILILPSGDYEDLFLKTIIVTVISKAECGGDIAIFSQSPIISEEIIKSRANNFNYSSFYI